MTGTGLQSKLPRVPLAKQGRATKGDCNSIACRKSSQEPINREAEDLCFRDARRIDLLSLNPTNWRSDLRDETTNWKAGCGKSARPVWREGQGSIPCPYPYHAGKISAT
jgi:hypothetical protein